MTRPMPRRITLMVTPHFPYLALAICTEVLRLANRELGHQAFVRTIVSTSDAAVLSSSGMEVTPDMRLQDVTRSDVVVVLASYEPEDAATPAVLAWLRRHERQGAVLACADTGGYLLARAGLLRGRRVAVHHESLAGYRETLGPDRLLDTPQGEDRGLLSSCGGMATADMLLRLVSMYQNADVAARVASALNYGAPATAPQSGDSPARRADPRLGRMVELMSANLETPLLLEDLCALCNLDSSTGRRLFLRWLGKSPGRYYRELRLTRAQHLLAHSALPVGEVAALTGYADASAFARAYKTQFGELPSSARHAAPGL